MRILIGSLLMLLWVASILVLPACGGPNEANASAPVKQATDPRPISITIVNRSSTTATQIGVSGAAMPISCGDLPKGGSSIALKHKELTLPKRLTLHWSDSRGDRKEGTVRPQDTLGPTFSGPMTLTITSQGKVKLTAG